KVPQPSTDANSLILKVSFAIAEDMYQNVVAFHPANGMLNKDTDLTQGFIGSPLVIVQLRIGVLFALARLPRRDVNLISLVVRLNPKIASIDSNIDVCLKIARKWHSIPCEPHHIWLPRPQLPARACRSSSL